MRILIYGLNTSPELTGIGKYTGEMAAWLAGRGHQVRVLSAPPYYPSWRIGEGWRNRYRSDQLSPNLTVLRAPLYVPSQTSGIKRMLHLFSFALASTPLLLSQIAWEPEVVFTVEPTFFCAPGALLTAAAAQALSWLHIQDLEVDAAFELGLLPAGGLLHRAAVALERRITRGFTEVS